MQVESSTTIEKSWITKWLGFVISYQIGHHMFPCANPAILLKLQPIVRQTAKEFGVKYHYFQSERAAIQSVYNHFKKLSVKPIED
jgi:fatty acid desaturase